MSGRSTRPQTISPPKSTTADQSKRWRTGTNNRAAFRTTPMTVVRTVTGTVTAPIASGHPIPPPTATAATTSSKIPTRGNFSFLGLVVTFLWTADIPGSSGRQKTDGDGRSCADERTSH